MFHRMCSSLLGVSPMTGFLPRFLPFAIVSLLGIFFPSIELKATDPDLSRRRSGYNSHRSVVGEANHYSSLLWRPAVLGRDGAQSWSWAGTDSAEETQSREARGCDHLLSHREGQNRSKAYGRQDPRRGTQTETTSVIVSSC